MKAIPFFTKFFGIKYPLSKLDLIGLNDVEIGKKEIIQLIILYLLVFFIFRGIFFNMIIHFEET